jgi:prevent-host-death family protein
VRSVNIHEAKTNLSRLVHDAAQGKAFIIAKAGKPMVKVIPIEGDDPAGSRLGFMAGEISLPADFDSMGSEEIGELFAGEKK